ncbi:MAG: 2-oxoglutarate dehydrogenase complex dihydrolipoyllysine-residue succinyltransferase [Verrucomicrobia bacterium]|nr:2-oxoglutarate dehydrogenase complex dihydrolipoyllysine-residue succinyltransferase [Verrucomicrobiota bacterium]
MSLLEVKIPPLGESISSGVLAKWHVKNGDTVKKDQPLFELETDKITSEGVAESAGVITFKVEPGTEVKIGQVVATIAVGSSLADDRAPTAAPISPLPAPSSSPLPAPSSPLPAPSPAVRRLAADTGIDPATVAGTGKAGRVTKGDMLAAASAPAPAVVAAAVTAAPAAALPASAPVISAPPAGKRTRKKMTKLRQTIATRLVQAQHEAAMLTTFNEVDMSAVMALRAKYQDDFVKKNGVKLGFMSFFTKAVVHALKEVPAINAQLDGDEIVQNHYYDISMAVSTEKGLVVPVVRDCDQLDLAGIEKAIGEVAKKARDGKLGLPDFEGGCFTITNGGIFGSMLSTPIINAPQSAILGLHSINDRPVALNGQVVIRPMMYLALSYDHRLVDGKEAVTFLVKVKQAIEDPTRLVLGV